MARTPDRVEKKIPEGMPPHRYWLHIDQHGEELRFRKQPDPKKCRTLLVEDYGDIEMTRTYTVCIDGDRVRVRPPGADWKMADDSLPCHTLWSRRVWS